MPNTQFITLLIITVSSLLAGIVSAVVLFGQLNAKKRERAAVSYTHLTLPTIQSV